MRIAKFFMVLLVLVFSTAVINAQYDNRYFSRKKGLVVRPEIGVSLGDFNNKSDQYYAFYLQGSVVYQFNPYFNTSLNVAYNFKFG